jgi:hypothetical protein
MRRTTALIRLALVGLVVASCQPSGDGVRRIDVPTHSGANVEAVDEFTGSPLLRNDCIYYVGANGFEMLPIWPPGWYAEVWPRGYGVFRPGEPKNAWNVSSEVLEFHGEWLRLPEDLDVTLLTGVPTQCQGFEMFLVAESIQRS